MSRRLMNQCPGNPLPERGYRRDAVFPKWSESSRRTGQKGRIVESGGLGADAGMR